MSARETRKAIAIAFALIAAPLNVSCARAPVEKERAPVLAAQPIGTSEATEIAWILAALSLLGRDRPGMINRDGPYYAAVEQWFGPHRNHAAVTVLGADFSLPRLIGNAADYSFTRAGRLVKTTSEPPLWDDAKGDLFARHLALVEDFARVTKAREFLRQHAIHYEQPAAAIRRLLDLGSMQSWLQTHFPARPGPVRVFVSPVTSGWNWVKLEGQEARIWVPAPRAETAASTDPVTQMRYAASVFTEVDHLYVNPVTKLHLEEVNRAFGKLSDWTTPTAAQQYPSPELVFNEYMTWATFLEYAREKLTAEQFPILQQRINSTMDEGRGFTRFRLFQDKLKELRSSRAAPIGDLFAPMLEWAAAQPAGTSPSTGKS